MSTLYIRSFLNLPQHHAGAHVIVDLNAGEGSIRIADCNKTVSLVMDGEDENLDNTLFKVEELHFALGQAVKNVRAAVRARDRRRAAGRLVRPPG